MVRPGSFPWGLASFSSLSVLANRGVVVLYCSHQIRRGVTYGTHDNDEICWLLRGLLRSPARWFAGTVDRARAGFRTDLPLGYSSEARVRRGRRRYPLGRGQGGSTRQRHVRRRSVLRLLRSRRVGRNVTQADTKIALAHLRRAGVGKLETSRDMTPVVPRPEVRGLPNSQVRTSQSRCGNAAGNFLQSAGIFSLGPLCQIGD